MPIKLHNVTWKGVRLVQVETLPHHIAGVVSNIRETLAHTDCEWEDIYSAYYDSEEDGTTTFYEGKSAEAGNPGLWTYVVYDCDTGQEEVITNVDLDTLEPALNLRQIVVDVIAASAVSNSIEQVQALRAIATQHNMHPDALLSTPPDLQQEQQSYDFDDAVNYVLDKNAELYRRLA